MKNKKKFLKLNAKLEGKKRCSNKANKIKVVKTLHFESESDSEDINEFVEDEDDDTTLQDIISDEILEVEEEMQFDRMGFEEGEYVLIGFTKKKKKWMPEHYVGKIVSKDLSGLEYKVNFYKRLEQSSKFVRESNEIFDVTEEDVIVKLPIPTELKGSTRIQGQLWFPVNFTNYNVK